MTISHFYSGCPPRSKMFIIQLGAFTLLAIVALSEQRPQQEVTTELAPQYSSCNISIRYPQGDLLDPQPLVLLDSDVPTVFLPSTDGFLSIKAGEAIRLECPGKGNILQGVSMKQSTRAVCRDGKTFLVGSKSHQFSAFRCNTAPKSVARSTGKTCLKNRQQYEIGFPIGDQFLRTIEVCRDDGTYRTLYSKYTLHKEITGAQHSYPRPYWNVGPFYKKYNIAKNYKQVSQVKTVTEILGSTKMAQKYIKTNVQYLSRGHLSAKAGFIYGIQQSATFWLLNTAPQWLSFNAGNWMQLELNFRQFSADRNLDLEVYTGVHGNTTLLDEDGQERTLYLHANETHKALPVPRYFWKIMHDPVSKRATAFVGLNEPFAPAIKDDMYLCPDISTEEDFSWLTWEPKDIAKGISYVCTVRDLRKAVPTVPDIGEEGLLY